MALANYPAEDVPKEAIKYMLDLVDRIQYAYLRTDGKYGDLHKSVSDKVKLIEKTLWKHKEEMSANTFVITERKCEMCKAFAPGASVKMILEENGKAIAKFHLCSGCIEEMKGTYKDVL